MLCRVAGIVPKLWRCPWHPPPHPPKMALMFPSALMEPERAVEKALDRRWVCVDRGTGGQEVGHLWGWEQPGMAGPEWVGGVTMAGHGGSTRSGSHSTGAQSLSIFPEGLRALLTTLTPHMLAPLPWPGPPPPPSSSLL